MDMPAMYRERPCATTVGDVVWAARVEIVALVRECTNSASGSTFGWETKALAFGKVAEELKAIHDAQLVPVAVVLPLHVEHMLVGHSRWEPRKKVPASRKIRVYNLALSLRAAADCLTRESYPDEAARLDQAARELEALDFPTMSGHQWRQPRADSGPRPGRTQVS